MEECNMKITIDGKSISKQDLDQWKKKSYSKAIRVLKKRVAIIDDMDVMERKLTEIKMQYSYDEIVKLLKNKLWLSERFMKLACTVSRGKRKFSITEIEVSGISAKEIIEGIDALMLTQSRKNNEVNLSACPEHYVLRPLGDNKQQEIPHYQFNSLLSMIMKQVFRQLEIIHMSINLLVLQDLKMVHC